jgi:hypothetical protein
MEKRRREIIGIPYCRRTLNHKKKLHHYIKDIYDMTEGVFQLNKKIEYLRKEQNKSVMIEYHPVTSNKRFRQDDASSNYYTPQKYTKLDNMKEPPEYIDNVDYQLANATSLLNIGHSNKLPNNEVAYRRQSI